METHCWDHNVEKPVSSASFDFRNSPYNFAAFSGRGECMTCRIHFPFSPSVDFRCLEESRKLRLVSYHWQCSGIHTGRNILYHCVSLQWRDSESQSQRINCECHIHRKRLFMVRSNLKRLTSTIFTIIYASHHFPVSCLFANKIHSYMVERSYRNNCQPSPNHQWCRFIATGQSMSCISPKRLIQTKQVSKNSRCTYAMSPLITYMHIA